MVEPNPNSDIAKQDFKRNIAGTEAKKTVFLGTPTNDNHGTEIEIIKGLSAENTLERIQRKLQGQIYNYETRKWEEHRPAVMNELGIGNIMSVLQALSDNANFSHYKEKEIPKLAEFFFRTNYPTFTVYHKEFDLDSKDFNIIRTTLLFYALSTFKNALNAGHRNTVRGTLSEDVFKRAMATSNKEEAEKTGFIKGLFGGRGK